MFKKKTLSFFKFFAWIKYELIFDKYSSVMKGSSRDNIEPKQNKIFKIIIWRNLTWVYTDNCVDFA